MLIKTIWETIKSTNTNFFYLKFSTKTPKISAISLKTAYFIALFLLKTGFYNNSIPIYAFIYPTENVTISKLTKMILLVGLFNPNYEIKQWQLPEEPKVPLFRKQLLKEVWQKKPV